MAGTYLRIARVTITSDTQATGVTFSNIPSTYKDLKIIANTCGVSSGDVPLVIRFNDDSGTNYSQIDVVENPPSDTNLSSGRYSNATSIDMTYSYNLPGSPAVASMEVDIFQYAGSKFKSTFAKKGGVDGSAYNENVYTTGLWRSTSAVTSVSLIEVSAGDRWLKTGSVYTLYGIGA